MWFVTLSLPVVWQESKKAVFKISATTLLLAAIQAFWDYFQKNGLKTAFSSRLAWHTKKGATRNGWLLLNRKD
ncbi:hypothetical protein TH63_18410 [Rufibacter radiotolerans]|uniref:Uncharacterized protein n=1 Tax=Rufibacter radiotolerans TaxID=1379910 RepID=A0A0H4VMP6_9BACT|nr:hypothetical protein TH63_18410 [Rufibacter radiotolerans]